MTGQPLPGHLSLGPVEAPCTERAGAVSGASAGTRRGSIELSACLRAPAGPTCRGASGPHAVCGCSPRSRNTTQENSWFLDRVWSDRCLSNWG